MRKVKVVESSPSFRKRKIRLKIKSTESRSSVAHREYCDVDPSARMLIGLKQSTDLGMGQIAHVMGVDAKELEEFWASLQVHPLTARIVEYGMPSLYGEHLPNGWTVACSGCGCRVTYVPCAVCWCPDFDTDPPSNEIDWPDCMEGDDSLPGSAERVEVMAARVAGGYSPFSIVDKVSIAQPDEGDGPNQGDDLCPIDDVDEKFEEFLAKLARKRRK